MTKSRPHLLKFRYHWLHIPSGETGVKEAEFLDRNDFLRNLDAWNASSPTWKYWSAS